MNSTDELFEEFEVLWKQFNDNHKLFKEKNNKSAAVRARKAIGEFKKLITDYRKLSVSESKN
jgi:hypothetical protein|tara:strand:- start:1651 stop:1836 length:186 start_codon:yes stop_codon:yes gene_type:complete